MENENYAIKTALMVTAGMGMVYFFTRYKNGILYQFKKLTNFNDPLRHRNIQVVEQLEQCSAIVKILKKHCVQCQVLGFDCEWVTVGGKRRPVALLQLASHEGLCALFRLNCLQQIPKDLRDLIEDENILKVGVSASDDAQKLNHDYGVATVSTFDLRYLAVSVGQKPEGIAGLAKSFLQVKLDKNWRLACSDWEAKELNTKQLVYAANDALVGIEVFKKLAKLHNKNICWKNQNTDLMELLQRLEPYYGVRFKASFKPITTTSVKSCTQSLLKNGTNKNQIRGFVTRSKPLYDNCVLESPDGEVLAAINKSKAEWYLQQGLGSIIPDTNKFTVRLNFQPAGRATGEEGLYYTMEKENRCVVCGCDEVYLRKNIVPKEYRKHFPLNIKSHTSHDVLLLCPRCHQQSNISDLHLRMVLAKKCDAPLSNGDTTAKFIEVPALKSIKSAARALLHSREKIPLERQKELEQVLMKYYQLDNDAEISQEFLEETAKMDTTRENLNFIEHGAKVVEKYTNEYGGLFELQKLWREHFIQRMKPQFLPTLWSVNHNAER